MSAPTERGDSRLERGDNGIVTIRDAVAAELPVLQGIDAATGQMFRDIGMPEVADDDPWPLPELEKSRAAGLLWVVPGEAGGPVAEAGGPVAEAGGPVAEAGGPVAFLMGIMVDGCLHVEQLSTDPGSARRGLGRSLLEYAAHRAAADGLPALTLTTFAHVPWNAPYYVRCGFRILDDAEVTPGLRAIRQREAALGLDRWPRVCMRRDIPGQGLSPGATSWARGYRLVRPPGLGLSRGAGRPGLSRGAGGVLDG